jgi:HSP20 family protein
MLVTRWQPFGSLWSEMNRFQDEVNRLFDTFGGEGRGWPAFAVAYPPLNIWEDADRVYVEAELPGMALDDLEIHVTGDQLSIKGERKAPEYPKSAWHRQERGFGKFARVITLPVAVDADKVEAKLTNGVLTLAMPKAEAAKPRKITVKAE